MGYRRRILRYGPSPEQWQGALEDRAIAGCSFELLRLGGCGRGEIRLQDGFDDRGAVTVGQWVACEYDDGDRWYLGRIEERQATSPGGITLRLEGMSVQLNETYPGGFGVEADGQAPHRYAATDLFMEDPDYGDETVDVVDRPEDVVRLLLEQYVVPVTDIRMEAGTIETAPFEAELLSLKFNGEETVRSILKDLALRVRNASWGVDELGRFYLLQRRSTPLLTCQEGVDLIELREEQTRDSIYNRVLLTGGYVYGSPSVDSEVTAAVRWRGNYRQPNSIALYGERRVRLWVPWIRTTEDSRQFVREFFRVYAAPGLTYVLEMVGATMCPRPWLGSVRVLNRHGQLLATGQPERVRVQFDNTPRLRLEIGPEDPRTHWPEPPYDERFPVTRRVEAESSQGPGGNLTLTTGNGDSGGGQPSDGGSGGDGGGGTYEKPSGSSGGEFSFDSESSSQESSEESSGLSSSGESQLTSSDLTSDAESSWLASSWLTSGFISSGLLSDDESGLTSLGGNPSEETTESQESSETSLPSGLGSSDPTSEGSDEGSNGRLSSEDSGGMDGSSGGDASSENSEGSDGEGSQSQGGESSEEGSEGSQGSEGSEGSGSTPSGSDDPSDSGAPSDGNDSSDGGDPGDSSEGGPGSEEGSDGGSVHGSEEPSEGPPSDGGPPSDDGSDGGEEESGWPPGPPPSDGMSDLDSSY